MAAGTGAQASAEAPVLIVALAKRYGGIDTRVTAMARAFTQAGRRCCVAATAGAPLCAALTKAGLPVAASPYAPRDMRNIRWLADLARSMGAGVMDAHNPQSYFMGMTAAALARIPGRLCTIHLNFRTFASGRLKAAGLDALVRFSSRLGADFLTVSNDGADYLEQIGIPRSRITVTTNALEVPVGQGTDLRQAFGFAADDFLVVVPARLEPQKGHRYLLDALRMARASGRPIRCLLAGDGAERPSLERMVREAGLEEQVMFLGFREDAVELIRGADLMCLPSVLEGLPYAALEAASVGTPLLLTSVGGIPDHFQHGVTARLVDARDPEGLARELHWCAVHRQELDQQAQAARCMVARDFGVDKMMREIRSGYAQAMARSALRA
ncbi:glycosyltransferase family 4 protein [Indioceanicola profundi]|uniref:glycosyltransferase family 4 protein n=1 Tax=Indioceanicola profundi TaxID=2220096 RepID=UPI000E6AB496|nr:glycosyltransferase family 4 protein [Indioceanicola profundi]